MKNLSIEDGGPHHQPINSVWEWLQLGISINKSAPVLIAAHNASDHLSHLLPDTLTVNGVSDPKSHFKWTYQQLETAALNVAIYLHSHDVGRSDVVSTFVDNSVEWVVIFWACIRLGIAFAPMDLRELKHPDELQYQMSITGTNVVIVPDDDAAQLFEANGPQDRTMKLRLTCNPTTGRLGKWASLHDVPTNGNPDTILPSTSSHTATSIALIQFTSGTTNRPKGIALPNSAFAHGVDGYRSIKAARFSPSTVYVITTSNFRPLYYMGSFSAWRSGGCVVLPNSHYDEVSVLRAIRDFDVTHLFTMKAQLRGLIRHPRFEELRPKGLKFINVTGDTTDRAVLREAQEYLRAEVVHSVWGMTEGTAPFVWNRDGDVVTFTEPEGLTGIGRPLPGTMVKICAVDGKGTEARQPIPRGQTGSMHLSSVHFFKGYLQGRDAESFYTDPDGRDWFVPGDTAMIDDNGIVYLMGRSNDIIKTAAVGLSPGAIEGVMIRQPAVEEAIAFGIPHEDLGAVSVVVVKTREGEKAPLLDELNEVMLRERGKEYKLFAVWELRELGFDKWPVNSSGKILKREVREAVIVRNNSER